MSFGKSTNQLELERSERQNRTHRWRASQTPPEADRLRWRAGQTPPVSSTQDHFQRGPVSALSQQSFAGPGRRSDMDYSVLLRAHSASPRLHVGKSHDASFSSSRSGGGLMRTGSPGVKDAMTSPLRCWSPGTRDAITSPLRCARRRGGASVRVWRCVRACLHACVMVSSIKELRV